MKMKKNFVFLVEILMLMKMEHGEKDVVGAKLVYN